MSNTNKVEIEKRKTIVRGMRWGYDGGGMACGPVPGSFNVELMIMDEKGHLYFILDSMFECYEKILVGAMPMFDLSMQMVMYGVDFDHEFDKVLKISFEEYDYEVTDVPEEMAESRYIKAIQLARFAMQKVVNMNDYPEQKDADEFIEEYLDSDLEGMDLPEVSYEDEDDEDDWDEE